MVETLKAHLAELNRVTLQDLLEAFFVNPDPIWKVVLDTVKSSSGFLKGKTIENELRKRIKTVFDEAESEKIKAIVENMVNVDFRGKVELLLKSFTEDNSKDLYQFWDANANP